jgi:ABC-type lipoprotein release transport system permease subunit
MLNSHTTATSKHWKLGDHVTLATPGSASVTTTISGIYRDVLAAVWPAARAARTKPLEAIAKA